MNNLKESKLLSAEEVQRVNNVSSSSADALSFAQSLVVSGFLTTYQLGAVLNREFDHLRISNYDVLDRLEVALTLLPRHRLRFDSPTTRI